MICEVLLLYSTVYMLFCSVKSCCWGCGEDDDHGDADDGAGRANILACPAVAYGSLGEKTRGQCGHECCVCLEPFEPLTAVNVLPCNHFLCHLCFRQWVALNYIKDIALRCPLCNQVVGEADGEDKKEMGHAFRLALPHSASVPSASFHSSSLY